MACERWREIMSAQLDGEDDPADRPAVDEHLAGCADCRLWLDRAATVNRLTRTGLATQPPDLTAAILAALPPAEPRPAKGRPGVGSIRRLTPVLYVALAVVGAVQLILGLAQVGGGAAGTHVHGLEATPGHLWHESAAWNVAIGAGYLFLALRQNRPTGLVPMLSAFVGMLLLLSFNDLTAGRVDGARLISHGFVLLGFLLVVALSRTGAGPAEPPGERATGGSGWRARFDDGDLGAPPAAPALRLVPRPPGPLTARHDHRQAA
jgi:predicted anti-sigma-YlaC factor YlaD